MELKIFRTGPLEVNTYVLTDEISKEAVIIDIGGSFDIIKKYIDEKGCQIKFILNTHGHFDHILGEIEVQNKYPQIPIYIHKDEALHYNKMEDELHLWGFNYKSETLKPLFIDENSTLSIGTSEIQILRTPGHSKGSLSYYIDGKLFTGDALFHHNIGRTDFYDGDYDELITSIKKNLLKFPDETPVYPGHGQSSTIGEEKKFNPYLK